MNERKTHHCTGCRNVKAYILDVVNEDCCTCCRDENDNRPGKGSAPVE